MFFPIGDDNRFRERMPIFVFAIIVINFFVWFSQINKGDRFTMAYSAVPFEITHGVDLVGTKVINIQGEKVPLKHTKGPEIIYLTLLSSMFMHGSWMHILGNMLYLWIFGDQIEDELGHMKFLIFYLVCGIAAGLAQIVMEPNSILPCLGASGAIAGVLGAYFILHPSNRVKVLVYNQITYLPASIVLGGWIVLQFFGQVSAIEGGGVAYMAHIGGFVAGLIMILLMRPPRHMHAY